MASTTSEYDYDYKQENTISTSDLPLCRDATCVFLALFNVIVFILGAVGNGVVIWIAGFKMKKTVNTTWYLSLAVSDLLFCCTLPINVVYQVTEDWVFGLFMCKFSSFVIFLNMFSSIFLLVIISVDRCVVVMFPVWAQNHRTVRKASVIVILFWIISAVLSTPPLRFGDVAVALSDNKRKCFNRYVNDHYIAVVVYQFVYPIPRCIPFLMIIISFTFIIRKLKINQSARSNKPFKIMTALIVTFFFCWIPFHIVALMELNYLKYENVLPVGQVIGATLAAINSCVMSDKCMD